MSFGYHRAEVVGALASVVLIWGLTFWLLYEAVLRFIHKPKVNGMIMLITACIGLVCNLVMIKVLHERESGSHFGHDHSHEHGDHDHGHGHGHSHSHSHGHGKEHKHGKDHKHTHG